MKKKVKLSLEKRGESVAIAKATWREKNNKKGQIYLIAAIIIVVVIVGLAGITNYITTGKKPVKFYDLSSELDEESARVIEYGIYNEKDIPKLIEDFTDNYFINYTEEKESGTELVFAYGNKNNITVSSYTSEKTGKVDISYGSTSFPLTGASKYVANRTSFTPNSTTIEVGLLGVKYDFNLQEGENFLFVINKKTEEETYIVRS